MVDRFIELEEFVSSTVAVLDVSLAQITIEEWIILKELRNILEPFEDDTRTVSGQQYITASLVIVITGGHLDICQQIINSNVTPVIKNVAQQLERGLKTRVGNVVEYSNTLVMCTFLDPRFKTFVFKNNDAMEKVKRKCHIRLRRKMTQKDMENIPPSQDISTQNNTETDDTR